MAGSDTAQVAEIAEGYYDSDDADSFYFRIWGGEDIHIGMYDDAHPGTREASRRTVATMADMVDRPAGTRVLDLGAGYGGSARYMAAEKGWHVTCLNISEVQNRRNVEHNAEQGLSDLVEVVHGSFEDVPGDADAYDVVWSQDAFLHSGDRRRVLDEIDRVLRPGGDVVFTDPMQTDDCPDGVLDPILARIHLDSLGSPGFYRDEFKARGFREVDFVEMPDQLRTHYATVKATLEAQDDLPASEEYVERMLTGLGHWVQGADDGHLTWGILHFRQG